MKTFKEWLAEYNKEHGVPPASVMAEAAWNYLQDAYIRGYEQAIWDNLYNTGDSDLYDETNTDPSKHIYRKEKT